MQAATRVGCCTEQVSHHVLSSHPWKGTINQAVSPPHKLHASGLTNIDPSLVLASTLLRKKVIEILFDRFVGQLWKSVAKGQYIMHPIERFRTLTSSSVPSADPAYQADCPQWPL